MEKIKIAKWTYMAACGLTVKGDSEMAAQALETHHTSSTLEVLLNFAVNVFKLFKEHNASFMEVGLRIGKSVVKVMSHLIFSICQNVNHVKTYFRYLSRTYSGGRGRFKKTPLRHLGGRCQYGVQNGQYRPNWYYFTLPKPAEICNMSII